MRCSRSSSTPKLTSTSRPFALLAITKLRFQTIEESVLQNYTGPRSACQLNYLPRKSGSFTIPNAQGLPNGHVTVGPGIFDTLAVNAYSGRQCSAVGNPGTAETSDPDARPSARAGGGTGRARSGFRDLRARKNQGVRRA